MKKTYLQIGVTFLTLATLMHCRNSTTTEDQLPGTGDEITVSFATSTASALEDDGSVILSIIADKISDQDIVIPFTVAETATIGVDYNLDKTTSVTIPAGASSVDILVTLLSDTLVEDDETFALTLATPINAVVGMTSTMNFTIYDSDGGGGGGGGSTTTSKIYMYDAGRWNGGLGGRAGSTAICENALPSGLSTYKAVAFLTINSDDEIRDIPSLYGVATNSAVVFKGASIFSPTAITVGVPQINGDKVIADSWAQLLDGEIEMSLAEAGVLDANKKFWTGSNSAGGEWAISGIDYKYNCDGFTYQDGVDLPLPARVGSSDYAGLNLDVLPILAYWMSADYKNCNELAHVLCIAYK